ncbi:hypothetical protein BJ508DRAFT_53334 [Ascobolus immersus RN42]|uniref:C2H2-type domain-containing protein n=1 Tax=Ascobolus immersus RN42 TaxID=1160509 RepID=A0A3N4HGY0_ASCIM|nr:hypothetical protein BJ508DRAFT_53334 [Ascobolus immersus RN42]
MGAVGQWGTPSYYHSSPWPGSTHGSEIVTTFAHRTAASTSIGPVMSSGDNATPYQPTGYLSPSEQLEREFPALYQIYSEPPQLRESLKLPDLPTDWWFDDHSLQEASTDTGYFSLGDAAEATQSGGSDLEEYSLEEPKVTTKDGARVYTCRYERCGRDFKRKCEYTRHFTEDHLLSSKYVCNHNSELFREVISAHPGSAGCPLKEGGCGRRFKDKKHFRKHVMYQHLTINPSKKDKRLLKQRNEYTAERSTEQEAKLEAREAGAGGEKQPCSPGVECGPGSPSCKSVQVEPSQSLAEKTTTRPLTHGTNSSETESEVGNLRAVDSPHRDGSAFGLDTAVSPRPNQSTTEAK